MPSSKDYKRNYDQEYKVSQSSSKEKKNRAKRNKARSMLEKEGRVHKGDGMDVDHSKPLAKGGSNSKSNLRVKSKSSNRSFKRDSKAKMK